jgi:hypothetical protein
VFDPESDRGGAGGARSARCPVWAALLDGRLGGVWVCPSAGFVSILFWLSSPAALPQFCSAYAKGVVVPCF